MSLQANAVHHVANTAGGAAASADIELNFTVPQGGGSFGACVLAKPPGSKPFVPHWEVVPNSNAAYDKVGVPGKAYGVSPVSCKLAHTCTAAAAAAAAQATRLPSSAMHRMVGREPDPIWKLFRQVASGVSSTPLAGISCFLSFFLFSPLLRLFSLSRFGLGHVLALAFESQCRSAVVVQFGSVRPILSIKRETNDEMKKYRSDGG